MNQYVTGAVIRNLREKNHLTQAELAEKSQEEVDKIVKSIALPLQHASGKVLKAMNALEKRNVFIFSPLLTLYHITKNTQ